MSSCHKSDSEQLKEARMEDIQKHIVGFLEQLEKIFVVGEEGPNYNIDMALEIDRQAVFRDSVEKYLNKARANE